MLINPDELLRKPLGEPGQSLHGSPRRLDVHVQPGPSVLPRARSGARLRHRFTSALKRVIHVPFVETIAVPTTRPYTQALPAFWRTRPSRVTTVIKRRPANCPLVRNAGVRHPHLSR